MNWRHPHHPHHAHIRIPSFVVFTVLVLFAFGLSVVVKNTMKPDVQKASLLERVDVVNVRDTSITLFWRTKEPSVGYVVYTYQGETHEVRDDRDVAGEPQKRLNHMVTLHGLSPLSNVSYRIGIDSSTVGQSAEVPFEASTTRKLTHARDVNPLVGTLMKQEGSVVQNAFVIAHIPQAKPMLAQSLEDGTFLFSLCCVVRHSDGEPLTVDETTPVRYEIITEEGVVAQAQVESPSDALVYIDAPENKPGYVKPQRQIAETPRTIPENRDGVDSQQPEVLAVTDSSYDFQDIDIIYPREGSTIPGTRPLIKGFAEPNMNVKGSFKPENRLFQVTANDKRYWEYEPSFDFQPGEHELVIETQDSSGKKYIQNRTFMILKSGESVLGDATGSATLTPSPTPTPEPTATATPTLTPSSTPPVTGINIVPLTLISLVLIVIGAGIVLLL